MKKVSVVKINYAPTQAGYDIFVVINHAEQFAGSLWLPAGNRPRNPAKMDRAYFGNHLYDFKAYKPWSQYFNCKFCGKKLSPQRLAIGLFRLEKQFCGLRCYKAAELKRYACCKKAKQVFCVCNYKTHCPVHGDICHGSHD